MKQSFSLISILVVLIAVLMTGCSGVMGEGPVTAGEDSLSQLTTDQMEEANAPKDALVFKVDMEEFSRGSRGVSTSFSDYVSVSESSPGKYVVEVNLRPTGKARYGSVMFSVYNDAVTSGYCVNIGDSATNNGFSGDNGTQQNDCEIQVVDNTFKAFRSDKCPTSKEIVSYSNFFPTSAQKNVRYRIKDNQVEFWKNFQTSNKTKIYDPCLFALGNQPDNEGSVNYTIYAAFNRSIGSASRSGSGIINTIYVYLQDPIVATRAPQPPTYNNTPAYEPEYWYEVEEVYMLREPRSIQAINSSYNYACNKKTDSKAWPGKASGDRLIDKRRMSNPADPFQSHYYYLLQDIIDSMVSDGLDYAGLTAPDSIPAGKSLIALRYTEDSTLLNYYRLDRDTNLWSYKLWGYNSDCIVTRLDESGNYITNPETGDFKESDFGGYFFVDSSYEQGQGTENIQ